MPPVVDLNLASAPEAVAASLRDSGFAVIQNHPLSLASLTTFYDAWDAAFTSGDVASFPAEAESQAGYFSPTEAETAKNSDHQDLKEYFQYWPGGPLPSGLRALTEHFYHQLFQLAGSILDSLMASTPEHLWQKLDKPLSSYLSSADTMLRILRYPPLTGHEPSHAIRAAAHEDIDFITLLPTASTPGLEIKPRGSEWQTVEAPRGSIIINIGDMLQELTDGYLPSTSHRVINPPGNDAKLARLTAPLFCHPYPGMTLSERYTAGQYLDKRLRQINQWNLRPGS